MRFAVHDLTLFGQKGENTTTQIVFILSLLTLLFTSVLSILIQEHELNWPFSGSVCVLKTLPSWIQAAKFSTGTDDYAETWRWTQLRSLKLTKAKTREVLASNCPPRSHARHSDNELKSKSVTSPPLWTVPAQKRFHVTKHARSTISLDVVGSKTLEINLTTKPKVTDRDV